MTKRLTIALLALAVFVVIAVLPVSAATAHNTVIKPGATVFVGESNLSMGLAVTPVAGVSIIAWFPSTATPTASTPEKTIDVTATGGSFYVNPADFSSRTGNWYCWTAGTVLGGAPLAFYAADPQLDIKVWDLDQAKDVTGKAVPAGEKITFRIETNAYPMASMTQRAVITPSWYNGTGTEANGNGTYYGVNATNFAVVAGPDPVGSSQTKDGFIDIKVKTDQGAILSRLYNGASNAANTRAIPLTGMFVDNQPW